MSYKNDGDSDGMEIIILLLGQRFDFLKFLHHASKIWHVCFIM